MDLLSLGLRSRKTGIRPKGNLKRDKFEMEDVDEFFAEVEDATPAPRSALSNINRYIQPLTDSNESNNSYKNSAGSFNNVARRINFTEAEGETYNLSPISVTSKNSSKKKNKKSPLRSPLQEHRSNGLFVLENEEHVEDFYNREDAEDLELDFDDFDPAVDNRNELDDVSSPEFDDTPRLPKKASTKTKPSSLKSAASLTRKMAIGKSSKAPRKRTTKQIEQELQIKSPANLVSNKRRANTSVRTTPQQVITKYSPLPSPPPEDGGLRRSRRTRIPPLAYWRNEKIIFGKAELTGNADTTLAEDLIKVPMQEIEEVVQVPEVQEIMPRPRRRSPPKSKKKGSVEPNYTLDQNSTRSKWLDSGKLDLNVFENEEEVKKVVAFAPDFGDFTAPESTSSLDNYEVAPLFTEDKGFCASGLIEFPNEGRKTSSNSKDSLLIFHVVKGLIEVKLGNQVFNVVEGCSFQVPPSNVFGFKNLSRGSARLFFVQTRVPQEQSIDVNEPGDDKQWE